MCVGACGYVRFVGQVFGHKATAIRSHAKKDET